MGQELSGKIAIVTGGASGIGRATVELFVAEGARVVIADVDAERGEEVAAKLGEAAAFKRTDVADADQVQELVDLSVAHFGGRRMLFCCVVTAPMSPYQSSVRSSCSGSPSSLPYGSCGLA